MAAAAARLLLRRRAEVPAAPSPALLRPLFPAPYSKLRPSLPAAAGALAGLPEVRRAHASPPPMPSLLRQYSSKAVSAAVTRLQDKCCFQLSPPHAPSLMRNYSAKAPTSAVANLKDMCCFKSSQMNLPSLMRSYSSKAERCCNTATYSETEVMDWFLSGVMKDLEKRNEMLSEINKKMKKAIELLDAGLKDESHAMFEEALDDTLKVIAVVEKDLDDLAKWFHTMNWPLDTVEDFQTTCKEFEKSLKSSRLKLKEWSIAKETLKILENNNYKWLKYVGQSTCVLLALLIFVGIFLA